jgi:hypothetical protein
VSVEPDGVEVDAYMHDLMAQVLVAFNVLGVVSAVVFFVAKIGTKIDRLGDSIDHLASVQEKQYDDHERRLRLLEKN